MLNLSKVPNIPWMKDSLFRKWSWENWTVTYERLELDPYLSPCKKINSKWTKYLNTRSETLKLLNKIRGNILLCRHRQGFLNRSPKHQETLVKNGWKECIKLRSFLHWERSNQKSKETAFTWEKVIGNYSSDRRLLPQYTKTAKIKKII